MDNCDTDNKVSATLPKAEKLCSDKEITSLFADGTSFVKYPLRVVFSTPQESDKNVKCQILTSVPKKRFKRAVKRNRIKRLMREAYRLNKHIVTDIITDGTKMNLAFVFLDTNLPTFVQVEKAMNAALKKIAKTLSPNELPQ